MRWFYERLHCPQTHTVALTGAQSHWLHSWAASTAALIGTNINKYLRFAGRGSSMVVVDVVVVYVGRGVCSLFPYSHSHQAHGAFFSRIVRGDARLCCLFVTSTQCTNIRFHFINALHIHNHNQWSLIVMHIALEAAVVATQTTTTAVSRIQYCKW